MRKLRNIALLLVAFFATLVISLCLLYNYCIGSVDNKNDETILVEIKEGNTSSDIAHILKEKELIRNEIVFKIYLKFNDVRDLKAGYFELNQSMNVEEIVNKLGQGDTVHPNEITILFKEGLNIRGIAKTIAENTNNIEEKVFEVLEDEEYIDSLIEKYWFLTDDIKHPSIYYPLEGYLFPNTYTFEDKNVTVKEIFAKMLNEMETRLSKYETDIKNSNYSVHEILTIASMTELEGVKDEDRKDISGVFYNRIKKNMSLGSDVTTYYAFKVDMSDRDLTTKEINTYNAYNTRGPNMNGKLPIGPIANPSKEAIESAIYPTSSNYLYFVADKNRNVYFTETIAEHDKKVNDLKKAGLWIEW